MSSNTEISATQLTRLVGLPDTPHIIDVRTDDDFAADPRLIPGSFRRDYRSADEWATHSDPDTKAVVICQAGRKLGQGVAAMLRHHGVIAEYLAGGFEAWRDGGGPLVRPESLPLPNAGGRSVWVTRARPKIDRIACPWLVRRFIDRNAIFLFVDAAEVLAVAERFNATPFDMDGVFWSHRGDRCTFDTMVEAFGLATSAPLQRLATIVRGADTAQLDLAPQCAGLLAASLGLSRMYRDDLAQLEAGVMLYDAFYRWCRDATDEIHSWPAPVPDKAAK